MSNKSISTGIEGLDAILGGGYPAGFPTIIQGTSGCGKTQFAFSFARSCIAQKENVVYATFDESTENLRKSNTTPKDRDAITFLDFRVDEASFQALGKFELGGLIIRIEAALKKSKSKILILDSFDVLFLSFHDQAQIRYDLVKLFDWCKERKVTLLAAAGITSDYVDGTGLVDYASECSIRLQQVPQGDLMTRKLHIIKCRGRGHGTNYYPFLIADDGVSVLPITNTAMSAKSSYKRLSTGVKKLDEMMGGKGFYEGSTVMISGESGTGKSLLAMWIAAHNAALGVKTYYISFEESPEQLIRNTQSIGLNLKSLTRSKNLVLASRRSVENGLEEHIINVLKQAHLEKPQLIVLDPISALQDIAAPREFKNMVIRLLHELKMRGHTVLMTELIPDDSGGVSNMNLSSLIDTWIKLYRVPYENTHYRAIYVGKSRGSVSDLDILKFDITNDGFQISV